MTAPIRVRKSRVPAHRRPWTVRYGARVLGSFPTGAEALAFVRRLLNGTRL